MLEIRDLMKTYPSGVHALRGVSVDLISWRLWLTWTKRRRQNDSDEDPGDAAGTRFRHGTHA